MKFGYFCNTTNWNHKPYNQLLDETKDIIKENDISITTSAESSLIYKKAFETVDSVDSKQIREFLNNFK